MTGIKSSFGCSAEAQAVIDWYNDRLEQIHAEHGYGTPKCQEAEQALEREYCARRTVARAEWASKLKGGGA